jgi:putative Mg2+ transporter-C (MgtC) family protein
MTGMPLDVLEQLELVLRLVVGLVLGAVIGWQREVSRQPAGFRTHSLVSLGAAIFTVVSAFGFGGDVADPARIAAQIVSGIGFIGAGTILQHRGHIRGLTTAASLWAVAALGMAAGAGMYVVAVAGGVLILIVLAILDDVKIFAARKLDQPIGAPRPAPTDEDQEGRTEDLP